MAEIKSSTSINDASESADSEEMPKKLHSTMRKILKGGDMKLLEAYATDGQIPFELGSKEEMVLHEEMKARSQGKAFMAEAGEVWQLACLRARKYNVDRALELCEAYMGWRKDYQVSLITPATSEKLRTQVEAGMVQVPGVRDRLGRLCVFVCPRYHEPERWSAQDTVRYLHYVLEQALLKHPDACAQGIVLVVDGHDATLKNADTRVPREVMSALSSRFPLRYGGHYIVNAPLAVRCVITMVKPFLSSKLRKRIKLLGNDYSKLQEYIDPAELPVGFGGKFEYDHRVLVENLVAQPQGSA